MKREKLEIIKQENGKYTVKLYNFNGEVTYKAESVSYKEVHTEVISFAYLE